jgi:hypothetical protein
MEKFKKYAIQFNDSNGVEQIESYLKEVEFQRANPNPL